MLRWAPLHVLSNFLAKMEQALSHVANLLEDLLLVSWTSNNIITICLFTICLFAISPWSGSRVRVGMLRGND